MVKFEKKDKNPKIEQLMEQSNVISFKGQNIYIGIDVHLKSWSVTVLSENCHLKRFTQDPNPDVLYKYLIRMYPEAEYYSVYEAGFCGFWIHERLTELGIHNIVVNPADVPTKAGERLQKTDAVDSAKLARSLRSKELKGIYIPCREALEMRSLIRLRSLITKDMTRAKNRIKAHLRFFGYDIPQEFSDRRWPKRFICWLRALDMNTEEGKKTLDIMLDALEDLRKRMLANTRALRSLSNDKRLEGQMDLITSVPGVGQVLGMTLLLEIGEFKRFKNAESLASYIGLVPMCHNSGEHIGTGDITVRKHSSLRTMLVEAAWVAIRQDPAMTLAYENLYKRMKPSKAIIIIARKMVNRIYHVMKYSEKYALNVVS